MKGVSGSENHLLTLLSGLDKDRFEVHFGILAESIHVPLLQNYKQTLEDAGVIVSVFVINKYFDLSLLWRLRRYILQKGFRLVHTHLIHADFYGTLAAKLAGTPIIMSSRHNDDRFRRYKPLIWLNRFLARWHSKVIVISDWVGKFLQEVEGISAEKIVCIHYGLEPEEILKQADPGYVRRQFQLSENVPVIGTIGRLTDQKGQRYLLQALTQIIPEFPLLRVVIVGDGELRVKLETQTKDLGLEANVIFGGYRHDAIQLLAGFDFFVLPSLWEGFGLVLLEAMALKKAIVASKVSAIPESVIDGETGILVPPKDVAKLVEALLRLLRHRETIGVMGEAGHKRLQQHFSVRKMVEATETLYLNIIGDAPC